MEEQSEDRRNLFKSFVKKGQIEFVGGGFVQSDEASPDFEMVIRQLENGHQYLYKEFGVKRVRVGWQIDPFGHSALTPSVWNKFGYEFLVVNRININFREQLIKEGDIEYVWEGVNYGNNESIFTHNLYDHYDPPLMLHPFKNHCFTRSVMSDEVLQRCLKSMYDLAVDRRNAYKHDKLMILYGDDFYYMNELESEKLYHRIEALRDFANRSKTYPDLKIRIATASEYFEAVKQTKPKLSVYKGDFFQYQNHRAGKEPAFWTGYYSTRPHLKQMIYDTHKLARAAEIAQAFSLGQSFNAYEASLALHHDAITGTCRPQVSEDYKLRLAKDQEKAVKAINDAIVGKFKEQDPQFALAIPYKVLIVYNPINWEKTHLLSLQVDRKVHIEIIEWNGHTVLSQSVTNQMDDEKTVYFKLTLPPLAFVTLFIHEYSYKCENCSLSSKVSEERSIQDIHYKIDFSEFGMIEKISKGDHKYDLAQSIWTYPGNRGGAYIFHPTTNGNALNDMSLEQLTIFKGPVIETAEIIWRRLRKNQGEDYYYQRIILYNEKRLIWKTGLYATLNEEILVRFASNNIVGDK